MSEEQPEATVQTIAAGYSLVTFGGWQVTIMPDGMISLPRLVRPADVNDLVGALLAASEVAQKQIDDAEVEQREAIEQRQQSRKGTRKAPGQQVAKKRAVRTALPKATS